MSSDRRTFLRQAAATAALGAVAGRAESQPPQASPRALNPVLLSALGDTVLPESLGTAGRARAVTAFRTWIAGYQPVVEEMHGYGNQEIRYTPADPAPGWNAQLEALDLLARRKLGRGFVALDGAARAQFLRGELARLRVDRLPSNPLTAPHVAVALLAHWADSSEATDLVYGARIGRDSCRVLGETVRKPLPLAPGPGH